MKAYPILMTAFLLLLFDGFILAQTTGKNAPGCATCKIECLCQHFLNTYRLNTDQSTLHRILSNWGDSSHEDLETSLPAPSGVKTMAIKFDGMGCVYPDGALLNSQVIAAFQDTHVNYKQIYKSTFYHLFNKIKFDTPQAVNRFKEATLPGVNFVRNSDGNIQLIEFTRRWNAVYLDILVKKINAVIDHPSSKITTIVTYIHGFNVPYALAHIQGNEVIKSVLDVSPELKPENILFLRVFWPSGEYKVKNVNSSQCDYGNIEKAITAKAFTYASNKTYFGGAYLRRILAQLHHREIPIKIITHSHGATMATTALINATNKFQSGAISDSIKVLMRGEEFANRDIRVFMNAPSIPGSYTFGDVQNVSPQNKYYYFVGYDNNDKTLKKQKVKVFGSTINAITVSRKLGSTTLGCNRHNEVHNTQQVMTSIGLGRNFESSVNSFQDEHDFFCYMLQLEFRRNLRLFMNDQMFIE